MGQATGSSTRRPRGPVAVPEWLVQGFGTRLAEPESPLDEGDGAEAS